ncbi:MAG: FGGY-family carbohydrate kinase [Actinobacteria bacterium]|nr:FGGY-family carbohydrate kinase [Actinomycetota bacterium]
MTVDADRYCLAIDLGTGGPKVGFVTLSGRMVWSTHREVKTEFLPHGGAEQDASVWWDVIRDAVRAGVNSGQVDASRVSAVSVTGQWASTVPVDANGVPVGPCVMWMDTRGGKHVRDRIGGPAVGYAPRAILSFIRKTGGAPSTTGADPIGHMLYLQHDVPEVHRAARWYLEPVDYLSMRFTGVAAASHASMTGAWLTDNRALDRMSYDDGLIKLVGLDAGKLPPLVPTGSVVGTVHSSVARELGLPDRVQVVTGTPDLHTGACGAGAVTDYQTHMAISTTSWISCPVAKKKTDAIRQIATVPGLSPERYLVADNHDTSGLAFQWLRDNVVTGLDFNALTALAADSPAGSGGVIFTPWLQGERSPIDDRNARGGFHNLSINTTKGDIVRATLEGVAYNDRWLHEAVEKFTGRRLDPIRIVGGGAQSDLWCQIHADVMDRTIERIAQPYFAQLKGAAIFAGLGLGAVARDDVRGLVELDTTFTPNADARAAYDELYAEFPGIYKAQKDMFKRLNRKKRS